MPLTEYQKEIARLLAVNRSEESHLAGGAALHFLPNSKRFSNDLDYFHDTTEEVAKAFNQDMAALEASGFEIQVEMHQPGYIRAIVSKNAHNTKIEWAHDSAWRFMPVVFNPEVGYQLHPVDLAVNKTLALAGRDEARDYIDILYADEKILPLGGLCWAAAGKDPGFTPLSLLELLKRRGKYRPEDFLRLQVSGGLDLPAMKTQWLAALKKADEFIRNRPVEEVGCLYYSRSRHQFVTPSSTLTGDGDIVSHFGKIGGILPRFYDGDTLSKGLIDNGIIT